MEHKGTRVLETERLLLRPFQMEDAKAMFANWASDPEVTKFLTWPGHENEEVTKALLEYWISHYEDPDFYNWGIEWKENQEVIGNISVVKLNESVESADMGYCMGRRWWGQGIMPEALRAVIHFLFTEVGVHRIAACHDRNNPKSGRVMEKSGMKLEGIWRAAGRNNTGICDAVQYSILREEYEDEKQ